MRIKWNKAWHRTPFCKPQCTEQVLLHVNYPVGPECEYRVPWNAKSHPIIGSQTTNLKYHCFYIPVPSFIKAATLVPYSQGLSSVSFSELMGFPQVPAPRMSAWPPHLYSPMWEPGPMTLLVMEQLLPMTVPEPKSTFSSRMLPCSPGWPQALGRCYVGSECSLGCANSEVSLWGERVDPSADDICADSSIHV